MPNEQTGSAYKEIIEQLSSQYGIFRDDIRLFLQLIFGSATLFGLILYWEISAKPGAIVWILVPMTVVSFAGLLALMMVFLGIKGAYIELLELKMNFLFGDRKDVFQYESYYVGFFESVYTGPKKAERGFRYFVVIWSFTAMTPCLLCAYSVYRLWDVHPKSAAGMALFIVISIITILVSAAKVVALRRRCNQRMLQDWKQSFTVPPVGDASGLPASKATGAGMEI